MGAAGGVEGGRVILPARFYRLCSGYGRRFETSLCLQGPAQFTGPALPPDIECFFIPHYKNALDFLVKWRAVSSQLEDLLGSFDVVLARMPCFESVEALRQAKLSGVKSYCLFIGEWGPAVRKRSPLLRSVFRSAADRLSLTAARSADVVLTHGTGLSRELARLGVAATPVIQGTLEPGDFLERVRRVDATRSFHVLTAARLVPTKNIGAVLEAVSMLNRGAEEYRLTVAGDGPLRTQLENTSKRMGLSNSVTFLGWVEGTDQMRALYANSDVFVLPSANEGISTALTEAMAAGLPVVSTSVGGLADIVQDGQNSVVLREPSPAAIATGIRQLRENPEAASALGAEGSRSVRKFLHTAWVDSFYERVISDWDPHGGAPRDA